MRMETAKSTKNGNMILKKYADNRLIRAVNRFLESREFIGAVAFLVLCSNVLGWELGVYTVIISYGIYLCLFARDMRSLAAVVPFVYATPSVQNNPASNPDSVFYPQNGMWLLIAYLAIFFILLAVRIGLNLKKENFFTYPRKFALGLLVLGGTFALGGVGQPEYSVLNLRYSFLLFASFFVFYYCMIALVDWSDVPHDYFAWVGVYFGVLLCGELGNIYLNGDVFKETGEILREKLYTGWGVYNNIACMLVCCIPCAFYLAATEKRPCVFSSLGIFFYIATFFTMSRNGQLIGAVILLVSAVFALWNKRNRKENLGTYGVFAAIVAVCLILFFQTTKQSLNQLLLAGLDDGGRLDGYGRGLLQFFASPFNGKGFYACDAYRWGAVEAMTFVPPRWHNTLIQILASCGIVGALAYGYHRYQTVRACLQKPTLSKTFVALAAVSILLCSLLDCHLFNIGPGVFYSVALAFIEKDGTLLNTPVLLGQRGFKEPAKIQ